MQTTGKCTGASIEASECSSKVPQFVLVFTNVTAARVASLLKTDGRLSSSSDGSLTCCAGPSACSGRDRFQRPVTELGTENVVNNRLGHVHNVIATLSVTVCNITNSSQRTHFTRNLSRTRAPKKRSVDVGRCHPLLQLMITILSAKNRYTPS